MKPTFVCQFSAGLASWQAAERTVAKHGRENVRLLFCDTLIEDEDAYRFLIEAAAHVFGIEQDAVRHLAYAASILPTIEDGCLIERKAALAVLRVTVPLHIPGLIWIADGRTPWEVFRDERFLGNSRVDPCSRVLKRELADAWHNKNRDPASTVRVFGLTFSEQDRIDGVRGRLAEEGWATSFPMDDPPYLNRVPLMQASLDAGIQPPRLYYFGFPHNNCGGFCCKMGHGSAAKLLTHLPRRYDYHERQEQEFIEYIGKPVSMLTDRRGGSKKTYTLRQFREHVQAGGLYDASDRGACSCFVNDAEMEAVA